MFKLLFLLLLVASCSKNKETPPSWFIDEAENTSTTLYGTGQAEDKEQSIENALGNLKEKIYTSVSSKSIMQNTFVNEQTANEYTKIVKMKTPQITIQNYKIEKMIFQNNTFYATVSLERYKIADLIFENLKKKSQKIQPQIEQYQNTKNIIKKVVLIQNIAKNCNEYIEIERFYNALGFAMEENICHDILKEYDKFQNKHIIEITNTNPAIYDTLSYVFAKKFTIMQKAEHIITYKTHIQTAQIENKHISALTIEIIQHNSEEKFEKKCIGSALQSEKKAIDMAFENCLNQAKNQTFEEFFNI